MEVEKSYKLDEETVKKIKEALSMDCSIKEVCLLAKISKQTYYNWRESFPKLAEEFDLYKNNLKLKSKVVIKKNIEEKEDKDIARWYLERRDKDFKPKSDLTSDNKPIPIYGSLSVKEDEIQEHDSDKKDIQPEEKN